MGIGSIIFGVVIVIFAVLLGVYASFTARRKGPILSNPYMWMSKEERKKELAKADIKAEYRQLTIVSGCSALMLALLSVGIFFDLEWPFYCVYVLIPFILIYAIASSVKSLQYRSGK